MGERAKDPKPKTPHVKAVPWKTSSADRTKAAMGGPPAYVRRAAKLERHIGHLFARAEKRHEAIMRFVHLRRREGRKPAVIAATVERCNERWRKWVEAADRFTAVNAEIEAYNECYPAERRAALKYVPVNEATFEPRPPLGPDDLYARFPFESAATS